MKTIEQAASEYAAQERTTRSEYTALLAWVYAGLLTKIQ
jgi:hypothetical protein